MRSGMLPRSIYPYPTSLPTLIAPFCRSTRHNCAYLEITNFTSRLGYNILYYTGYLFLYLWSLCFSGLAEDLVSISFKWIKPLPDCTRRTELRAGGRLRCFSEHALNQKPIGIDKSPNKQTYCGAVPGNYRAQYIYIYFLISIRTSTYA